MAFFLALSDIAGSSLSKGHENWFELSNFEFDASGKSGWGPLNLTLTFDTEAVAGAYDALLRGKVFEGASIEGTTSAAGGELVTYALNLAQISFQSVNLVSGPSHDTISLQVTLLYQQLSLDTKVVGPTGDIAENKHFGVDLATGEDVTLPRIDPPAHIDPNKPVGSLQWFMAAQNMDGGSTDVGHQSWFEIAGLDLSALAGAVSGTGKPILEPLVVELEGLAGLARFQSFASNGKSLGNLQLELAEAGNGTALQRISLAGVRVTSVEQAAGAQGINNQVSLSFDRIVISNFDTAGALQNQTFFNVQTGSSATFVEPVAIPKNAGGIVPGNPDKFYVAIGGLSGNEQAQGHENWFALDGFDLDIASNLASGKPNFDFLELNILDYSAFAQLMQLAASNGVVPGLTVHGVQVTGSGERVVMDLSLRNLMVKALAHGPDGSVRVSMSYEALEIENSRINPTTGQLASPEIFGFDLVSNSTTTVSTTLPAGNANSLGEVGTYFVKIDGLRGASTVAGREGWFELTGYEFDMLNSALVNTPGVAAGRATFSPVELSFADDQGFIGLLSKMSAGAVIRGMIIDGASLTEQGIVTTFRMSLGGVRIADLANGETTNNSRADGFSASLFYNRIKVETFSDVPGALPLVSQWNLANNTANFGSLTVNLGTNTGRAGGGDFVFLALDGLRGSSLDENHRGWLNVLDVEFSATAPNASSSSSGKVAFDNLIVTLSGTTSLGELMEAMATGRVFSAATLEGLIVSGLQKVKVHQSDFGSVKIMAVDIVGTLDGPALKVQLAFGQFEITNWSINANGTLTTPETFAWDTLNNVAIGGVGSATPGVLLPGSLPPSFMLIDGVNGDSITTHHGGWIEIAGLQFSSSVDGTGKAVAGTVAVTVYNDHALTQLLALVQSGKTVQGIRFDGVDPQGRALSQLALGSATIVSVEETGNSQSGNGGGYVIRIAFETMTSQILNTSNGVLDSFGWDFGSGTPFSGEIKADPLGSTRDDVLSGTGLGNVLQGLAGNDSLFGLAGNDLLDGGSGNDVLDGGTGVDTANYAGLRAGVVVNLALTTQQNTGAGGRDTLVSIENLVGTFRNDKLTGNSSVNMLEGGSGDDLLDGGLLGDTMLGGRGNDTFIVDHAKDVVIERAGEGIDTIVSSISRTLDKTNTIENLTSASSFGNLVLTGNGLGNRITGGDGGSDTLRGLSGEDTLLGLAGDDVLDGGLGSDVLNGGLGADRFTFSVFDGTIDTIEDFVEAEDLIGVSAKVFGLDQVAGKLLETFLLINSSGKADDGGTKDTRFIYNKLTGELSYDADGAGTDFDAKQIALVKTIPSLSNADFEVF